MGNYHDDLLGAAKQVVEANEELTKLQNNLARLGKSRQDIADAVTNLQGTIMWMANIIENSDYYLD